MTKQEKLRKLIANGVTLTQDGTKVIVPIDDETWEAEFAHDPYLAELFKNRILFVPVEEVHIT